MFAVHKSAAPASRNTNICGYGSRLALRLAGTTEISHFDFQRANSRHTSAISRLDAPELCQKFLALRSEGAGNAGCTVHPIAARARIVKESTRVRQVTPKSPGIPRAMVLRLIACSPRRSGFLATVARASKRELDASVEASGPHDFAVRKQAPSSLAPPRVHRIPPRGRDDRVSPLLKGRDGEDYSLDFGFGKTEIFFLEGLDTNSLICLVGQSHRASLLSASRGVVRKQLVSMFAAD